MMRIANEKRAAWRALLRSLGLCLLSAQLAYPATYYVASATSTPAGSDANAGTVGAPWLTLSHAMATIACGDTVNIVADGNRVAGDANVPYFAGCSSTTTIQSSLLANFKAIGFRTNPAVDSANYGKLTMTAQGIWAQVEGHGSFSSGCLLTTLASDVFTLGFCNAGWQNVTNGTQVFLEIGSEGFSSASTVPSGLTILQKYFIVSCSSCGAAGGTFQLSATSGGSPITGMTCTGTCIIGAVRIYEPLQVDIAGNTLTSPDALVVMANNSPVYVSSSGLQLNTLTTPASSLPAPLALDTLYYMVSTSGRTFGLATSPGGMAIDLTTIGSGPLSISDARAPNHWAFRGLELMQASGHAIFGGMYVFGVGNEASTLGVVNNIEVDRNWIHEDPSQESSPTGPQRGIWDNAATTNYHDNYIAGITNGEANGIAGCGSPGPTLITDNFIEASGENTLYGGCTNASGMANANKTFSGNYFYKPPMWRQNSFTGAPSGACWYDNYDPHHTGGQWYTDTNTGTHYQCNSSSMWASTGSTPPSAYTIKTMTEHKNGRAFTYNGNAYAYNWGSAQSGQAWNNNQEEGSGPGMANDTITITNNKVNHVLMFGNMGGSCGITVAVQCLSLPHDHVIKNNVILQEQAACGVPSVGGTADCGYHMFGLSYGGHPSTAITWDHNTVVTIPDGIGATFPWTALAANQAPNLAIGKNDHWIYTNSIVGYDFGADSGSCGAGINNELTNSTFDRIANSNNTCASYTGIGATNTFTNWSTQTTNAGLGFVNLSGGDFHLASTSPYSAANATPTLLSSNGTDLGADIDAINAATSGAVVGTPTWAVQEGFNVAPASTGAVITYTRPGTTACSLTIYNAPVRIAANENADTNTSGKKLDTRTGNTIVGEAVTFNVGFNSPLTPGTQYWYSLSCVAADMSIWLLAGDSFTTTGTGGGGTVFGGNVTVGANVVH